MKRNKRAWVKAGEHGWICFGKKGFQFQDIAEGFDGRDIVTFEYQGKQYESFVIVSYSCPN